MQGAFVLLLTFALDSCFCQTYVLTDTGGLGRVFDGVGGLSGGGVSQDVFWSTSGCYVRSKAEEGEYLHDTVLIFNLGELLTCVGHVSVAGELRGPVPEPDPGLPVQGKGISLCRSHRVTGHRSLHSCRLKRFF